MAVEALPAGRGRWWRAIAGSAERLRALTGWRRLLAAMALGAGATLAMPPAYVTPVLLIAFPGLLWLLDGARSRLTAFAVGWAFSFGFLVAGLYWVAWALTVDLARFFWMLPFAIAGLPAVLALFHGVTLALLNELPLRGAGRALGLAVLWTLAEWLRGHLFTGFPWNLIGYGWSGWLPVLQSVALIGVYGLSLLTVAVAALPYAVLRADRTGWSATGLGALGAGLLLFVGIGAAGGLRLAGAEDAVVPSVWLRLVQPNIAQSQKWDPALQAANFLQQIELSRSPGYDRVTHVIWSETAAPYFLERDDDARRLLAGVAPPGGLVITGAPRLTEDAGGRRYWNSLQALTPDGAIVGTFDKFHLVPFGEYVPLRGLLPIDTVAPGLQDFSAGPGPRTLSLPGLPPVAPLICYEVIFPGAVIDPAERPQWLVNVTNDAWYGETAGPHQHFAIARTRAVEEGLPLVRVAMTGISGIVDPYGRIVARLGLGERGVVDGPLPAALPPTPYVSTRDAGFWALSAVLLGAALGWRRRLE